MSRVYLPHKFRGQPMSAALQMAGDSVGYRICVAIRDRYGILKHAAKIVSRQAQSTPRTAENWFALECTPRSTQLVELMASDPEFEAAVIEIVRERRAERAGA